VPHIILTNHARERLQDRKITMSQIEQAIAHPTSVKRSSSSGQKTFLKHIGKQTVTIVAAPNPKGEWVVLSCWVKPPNPGTRDEKDHRYWLAYTRASFFGKFWLVLKKQLGFL